MRTSAWQLTAAFLAMSAIPAAQASYGLYVGKNLTEDGSAMLGGSGEEVSSHWLRIEPRQQHAPDATIEVGVTGEATYPGKRIEIPQAETTYRFISMDYSNWEGFPPPLTNGGLNEQGVAGRDIWSPSRKELKKMTPEPQTGVSYSDIARIVMQRADSARQAVEIAGRLIDKHGYATYGGNSHLFADANEAWVMIEFAGGRGLWAAKRLSADSVRLSYPGYIGEIPNDCADNTEQAMCSDNFIAFAEKQGWYDSAGKDTINVHEVYGDQDAPMRNEAIQYMENKLRELAPVSLREFMNAVRDPAIADDAAGYGQVAHLRSDVPADLQTLWVAPASSVGAPFIPWRIGVTEVPPQFRKHRYLSRESDATYVTSEYARQEATQYAFRLFERVLYFACHGSKDPFYSEVLTTYEAFENQAMQEQDGLERSARILLEEGEQKLARKMLTRYATDKAERALTIGNALARSLQVRTKLLYGIPAPPENAEIQKLKYNMIRCGKHPGEPPL